MRRDGWIYGLAFVAILGIGAWLIVPRILRLRDGSHPELPPPAPPLPVESPRPPVKTWLHVRVRGPRGALLGPLKEVVGAELGDVEAPEGGVADLRLRATADEVSFGAAGHQWSTVPASRLADGAVVELPEAAPSLIVRVRETGGAPAARVPVHLLPTTPGPVRETDGGGAVVLDDLAPGLLVVQIGGIVRRGPTLRLVAGHDRDVKVVLEPAWRVQGRAVDDAGRPIPGARVEGLAATGLVGRATETDASGRFVWIGPVAAAVSIRITRAGVALATREAVPPSRGALDTDLGDVRLVRPVVTLDGRVLAAASSQPVEVRVEPAVAAIFRELFGATTVLDAPFRVDADPDGRFRVVDVPADLPLRISVRGGGLPLDDIVTPDATAPTFSLSAYAPPPGHALSGRIVEGAGGTPRPGVVVRVSLGPADGADAAPGDREVITDGAGRFRVDGLPLGRVWVRAFVDGRRPLFEEVALPRAAPVVLALIPVDSDRARRVEGVVVDDRNEPLAGIWVRAAGRETRTDGGGRFLLDDVEGISDQVVLTAAYEPGVTRVGPDATSYVAGVRRVVTPGAGPLKLVLPRAAQLRFRVLDGLDDVPLSFVSVMVRDQDGEVQVDRAVATRDGEVWFDGLLPRGGTLSIFSTRNRLIQSLLLRAGKTTDLGTLRLARGIHLTGRVVDMSDEPIAGAHLAGVEPGWVGTRDGDPAPSRELDLRQAVSGEDGSFVLDGFDPKKPAILAVWAPGYAPAARRVVLQRFQDDVHVQLTVRLQRGGWLAVELLERDGEHPISGAVFDLEDARNGSDYLDLLRRGMLGGSIGGDDDWQRASRHFLFEQEAGRYRLGPAEPGPYEVWVDRPGYRPIRRKLTILDPSDAIVNLADGPRAITRSLYMTWEMEPGD